MMTNKYLNMIYLKYDVKASTGKTDAIQKYIRGEIQ